MEQNAKSCGANMFAFVKIHGPTLENIVKQVSVQSHGDVNVKS